MNDLTNLLIEYSVPEIFLILVLSLVCGKFILELLDFFYKRIKKYILSEEEVPDKLSELDQKIDKLSEKIDLATNQNKRTEEALKTVQERLQENTRAVIIDAHHKYVYEHKMIDDITLQSLERRYLYYKAGGGNSFIDTLMEEIRTLPRLNFENIKSLETINGGDL